MDHRQVNQVLADLRQLFIVLAQTAGAVEPTKGAFHDPTLGQDLKPLSDQMAGDLHRHAKHGLTPVEKRRLFITAIEQEQRPTGDEGYPLQHRFGTMLIREIRRQHQHPLYHPQHVTNQMAFAPFHLLATVVASCPLFRWFSPIGYRRSAG